jgi:DNA polymerase III subunit epsilon
MYNFPVVYVDIETTGGSARASRVLEVAAIRVEPDGVVREYSTLINPDTRIPNTITRITGITESDIIGAPKFTDVADELYELMQGAVFIAHNVRFDYSFLKMEFSQLGMSFTPKLLCTVRLSRALYQHERGHSLAKLIERHEIPVLDRHRALADAHAIKYFAELAFDQHGEHSFAAMVDLQLRSQALPPNLDTDELEAIGNVAGVYIFKDENGQPLYVGKSVNLRNRIMSHFRDTSAREVKIAQAVHHVETIPTGSELAALILESKLVKELQPLFNRQLRRVRRYAMLIKSVSDAGYPFLNIVSGQVNAATDLSAVYGVYQSRTKAKARTIEVTRTFELCPKLMGIENGKGACFSYSLGRCRGACIGEESTEEYTRRFETALMYQKIASWPFNSPVTVPINTMGERVIIKNWMIAGYLNEIGERLYDDYKSTFDVDEYKIIKRFLRENIQAIEQYE